MTSNDVLYLSNNNNPLKREVICSAEDIDIPFHKAELRNPNSFYLVYEGDYGNVSNDSSTQDIIPKKPTSRCSSPIHTDFNIGSARGYNLDNPGIVIFAYQYYRGTGKQYTKDDPDITGTFPVGVTEGVSSYVVTGGKWELWTGKNYSGAKIDAKEMSPNYFPGNNDTIQSVRFIDT